MVWKCLLHPDSELYDLEEVTRGRNGTLARTWVWTLPVWSGFVCPQSWEYLGFWGTNSPNFQMQATSQTLKPLASAQLSHGTRGKPVTWRQSSIGTYLVHTLSTHSVSHSCIYKHCHIPSLTQTHTEMHSLAQSHLILHTHTSTVSHTHICPCRHNSTTSSHSHSHVVSRMHTHSSQMCFQLIPPAHRSQVFWLQTKPWLIKLGDKASTSDFFLYMYKRVSPLHHPHVQDVRVRGQLGWGTYSQLYTKAQQPCDTFGYLHSPSSERELGYGRTRVQSCLSHLPWLRSASGHPL